MKTKLITNDSFFDENHLQILEGGRKYAILVVDRIFFFTKEEGFLEDFLYTITLYQEAKTKNLLTSMFSAKYQNSESAKNSAKALLDQLVFKTGQVGTLDLEQQASYFHIKKRRSAHTRSQLGFNQLLAKKILRGQLAFEQKLLESYPRMHNVFWIQQWPIVNSLIWIQIIFQV